MKNFAIGLLFFLPTLVFACSLEERMLWQTQAYDAQAEQNYALSLDRFKRLADCEPLRGDFRVELLRAYSAVGDLEQAEIQKRWLINNNAPVGLIQLAETWIQRGSQTPQLSNTSSNSIQRRTRVTLGSAYSSNANEVTSQSSIPVEIDGVPLQLELTERPEPSNIHSLQIDYQHRTRTSDVYIGGQFQDFSKLQENEQRLMGGMIKRYTCIDGMICDLNLHLHHQQRASNEQQQLQLGTSLRTQQQAYGAYYRFLHSNTEPHLHSIGIDWRLTLKNFQLHSALEHEQSQEFRPGGDRTRIFVSATFMTTYLPGLMAQVSHQQEYDQIAYAPIFWGEQKRNRQTSRVRLEYTHPLSEQWFVQTDLVWQSTKSDLVLFSHRGWSTGIKIHRLF